MSRLSPKIAELSPNSFSASSPKLDKAKLHGFPRARLHGTRKRPAAVSGDRPRSAGREFGQATVFPRIDRPVTKIARARRHSPNPALFDQQLRPAVFADSRSFYCSDTPERSKYQRRAWQALYSEQEWKDGRREFLRANPLCAYCMRYGIKGRPAPQYTPASVVDHVRRHKGDRALFYDRANWQPLCKWHHDSVKQTQERRLEQPTYGADGWPLP